MRAEQKEQGCCMRRGIDKNIPSQNRDSFHGRGKKDSCYIQQRAGTESRLVVEQCSEMCTKQHSAALMKQQQFFFKKKEKQNLGWKHKTRKPE
jgi:hypothetical protein